MQNKRDITVDKAVMSLFDYLICYLSLMVISPVERVV